MSTTDTVLPRGNVAVTDGRIHDVVDVDRIADQTDPPLLGAT